MSRTTFIIVLLIVEMRPSMAQDAPRPTYRQIGQQVRQQQQEQQQFINQQLQLKRQADLETERNTRQVEFEASREALERNRMRQELVIRTQTELWRLWSQLQSSYATMDRDFEVQVGRLQKLDTGNKDRFATQRQSRLKQMEQSAKTTDDAKSAAVKPAAARGAEHAGKSGKTERPSRESGPPQPKSNPEPHVQQVTVTDQTPRQMIALKETAGGGWSLLRGLIRRHVEPSTSEKLTGPVKDALERTGPALGCDPIVSTNEHTNKIRARAREWNQDLRKAAADDADTWLKRSSGNAAEPKDLAARSEWLEQQVNAYRDRAKICDANADAVRALWAWDNVSDPGRWWVSTRELDDEARRETLNELKNCRDWATRTADQAEKALQRIEARREQLFDQQR